MPASSPLAEARPRRAWPHAAVALPLAATALVIVGLGPPWLHGAVLVVCASGALREYLALAGVNGAPRAAALAGGAVLALSAAWPDAAGREAVLGLLVLAALGVALLARAREPERVGRELRAVLAGWLYLPWLLGFGARLIFAPGGRDLVLFLVLATTLRNAAAAQLGPRLPGAAISPYNPRKTWTGAALGVLVTLAVMGLLHALGWRPFGAARLAALTLLLGVAGQAGDLAGSMFKRLAHVSSSGRAFGAQGGFLDLVDGYVFTAPALYFALALLG